MNCRTFALVRNLVKSQVFFLMSTKIAGRIRALQLVRDFHAPTARQMRRGRLSQVQEHADLMLANTDERASRARYSGERC